MKQYLSSLKSAKGAFALSMICACSSVHANNYDEYIFKSTPTVSADFDSVTPMIVGGDPVAQGDRTYQVSLGNGGCGGTIIADQWILTAAHCISSSWPGSVRVGVNSLSSSQGETHNVIQTIVHEGYSSASSGNDIALLKVSGTINPNYVRAKLPTSAVMQAAGSPGDMQIVSGWGRLSSGGTSPDILQEVKVPVVSNAICNSASSYNGSINDTMICAGYQQGGKDSCQGDSGGPMVAAYQNEIYSVGVVSWGHGCAAPNKYGVYARTFKFVDWINSKIGGTQIPNDPIELQNKVTQSVSANQGEEKYFYLDIADGAAVTNLNFDMSGGTGDADLYVKFGATPTENSYDCRPYENGNTESCNIADIKSGRYHVMLRAYSNFSNTQLTASYDEGSTDGKLENGVTTIVAAGTAEQKYFYIDVPAGTTSLNFSISGGTGDADLYMQFGAKPTLNQYQCRPYKNGNNETCTISNVQPGRYHVMLNAYSQFSDVSLIADH